MNYIKTIDGLRGLSVLAVIFFHMNIPGFQGGFIGVDIFFVISGFLITSIILKEKKLEIFSLKDFYERRARRLLPSLFIVIFFTILISPFILLPGELKDFGESLIATSFFSSNIFFWREAGYFENPAHFKLLLHTWSLAIEEQFYILFPIFLLSCWRLGLKNLNIFFILSLCATLSFTLANLIQPYFSVANFYLLPTRAWELIAGVLIAFYLQSSFHQNFDLRASNTLNNFLSIVGLLLIIISILLFNANTPHPGLFTSVPIFGAVLLLLFVMPGSFMEKILGSKIMVHFGLLSYSLYLWHWPLNIFFERLEDHNPIPINVLVLVTTYFFALLTWSTAEKYFRNKKNFSSKQILSFSLIGVSFFLFVSPFYTHSSIMSFKYPYANEQLLRSNDEFSDYVISRSSKILEMPFNVGDTRKKILIIGDSYASDMLNAAHEGGFGEDFQYRIHYIGGTCGALFLKDYSVLSPFVTKNCQQNRLNKIPYGEIATDKSLDLIQSADYIWLASSWKPWVLNFLGDSIQNLSENTEGEIIVFGRKDFGPIDLPKVLSIPSHQRAKIFYDQFHPDFKSLLAVNKKLKKISSGKKFIDFFALNCSNTIDCKMCDHDGLLISYDGNHLTKEGASYFGEKIKPLLW
jgi:peptidoglycan/LPS O-acetylase OafA/YrhL